MVISSCLLQMVVGSFWFQKNTKFWLVSKIGGRHCANRAMMLWWFGAKKVKTKVHSQNQRLA